MPTSSSSRTAADDLHEHVARADGNRVHSSGARRIGEFLGDGKEISKSLRGRDSHGLARDPSPDGAGVRRIEAPAALSKARDESRLGTQTDQHRGPKVSAVETRTPSLRGMRHLAQEHRHLPRVAHAHEDADVFRRILHS